MIHHDFSASPASDWFVANRRGCLRFGFPQRYFGERDNFTILFSIFDHRDDLVFECWEYAFRDDRFLPWIGSGSGQYVKHTPFKVNRDRFKNCHYGCVCIFYYEGFSS